MNMLVPIMEGFEEMELIAIVDTLRRAGINAIIARDSRVAGECIKGAHGINIKADCTLGEVAIDTLDGIALAGGFDGMMNLKSSAEILEILKRLDAERKLIAAICASPIVLGEAGVLKNRFCCYPGCEDSVKTSAVLSNEIVCVDENIITSIGPASAVLFALAIVKYLKNSDESQKVRVEMLGDRVFA